MCKNGLIFTICLTDGHQAESTFGMDDKSLLPIEIVHGIRTKHPTDITPHVHFVIGGQKPPHVFLKADKTPHAQ